MTKSLAALCVAVLLSACGQTGALYLPDHGKPPAKNKNKPAKVVPVGAPLAAPGAQTPNAEDQARPAADADSTPTPQPSP